MHCTRQRENQSNDVIGSDFFGLFKKSICERKGPAMQAAMKRKQNVTVGGPGDDSDEGLGELEARVAPLSHLCLKHCGPSPPRTLQEVFDPKRFGLEYTEETRVCIKPRRTRDPG